MDELKVIQAEFIISQAIKKRPKFCLFWSGGKDSMALLHLVKFRMGIDCPIVCFKEPWMQVKHTFTNVISQAWNLDVWDWPPSKVSLCQGRGRIDIIQEYQISPNSAEVPSYVRLARGTERPEEGLPFLCGLETFLSRPAASFSFPWDLILVGHKSCDEDPCSGTIPLQVDIKQGGPFEANTAFPLRNWTDDDVFEYIEQCGIPHDETRYDVKAKKVLVNNKELNPDYYHTCLACVERGGPKFVQCPKYDVQMDNISDSIAYTEPRAEYCSLRT